MSPTRRLRRGAQRAAARLARPKPWSYAWRRDIYGPELAERYGLPIEQARRIAIGRRLQPGDPMLAELRTRRDVRLSTFVQTAEGAQHVVLDVDARQGHRVGIYMAAVRRLIEAQPGMSEDDWMRRFGQPFQRRWRRAAPVRGIEAGSDEPERDWRLLSDPRAVLALVATLRGVPPDDGGLVFESGTNVRRRTSTGRRAA